jgi:hypothetical protein
MFDPEEQDMQAVGIAQSKFRAGRLNYFNRMRVAV